VKVDPRLEALDGHSADQDSTPSPAYGARAVGVTAQVVVEFDGRVERIFQLTDPVVKIGRTPGNALPLQHEAVSRQHAELRLTPEGAILTDTDSKNGTFVGHLRLTPNQPVRLTPGAAIRIGPFVLHFEVTLPGAAAGAPWAVTNGALTPVPLSTAYAPAKPARDRTIMPLPKGGSSKYLDYLPVIFHDGDFMSRFLLIFQSMWEPLEQRQDHLAMYIDPRTSPASFLEWLAAWLGITVGPRFAEGRLRALLSEAVELYRWRGTNYGLTRMIEVCTGATPIVSESAANPFVLHIRVALPAEGDVDRDAIERLIVANKPAHTAYFLEVTEAAEAA
jgi:phage tail-like protein